MLSVGCPVSGVHCVCFIRLIVFNTICLEDSAASLTLLQNLCQKWSVLIKFSSTDEHINHMWYIFTNINTHVHVHAHGMHTCAYPCEHVHISSCTKKILSFLWFLTYMHIYAHIWIVICMHLYPAIYVYLCRFEKYNKYVNIHVPHSSLFFSSRLLVNVT